MEGGLDQRRRTPATFCLFPLCDCVLPIPSCSYSILLLVLLFCSIIGLYLPVGLLFCVLLWAGTTSLLPLFPACTPPTHTALLPLTALPLPSPLTCRLLPSFPLPSPCLLPTYHLLSPHTSLPTLPYPLSSLPSLPCLSPSMRVALCLVAALGQGTPACAPSSFPGGGEQGASMPS